MLKYKITNNMPEQELTAVGTNRSYLDYLKENLLNGWDKIKSNTFVNMIYPIEEVSNGNTMAGVIAVVPGATAVKTVAKPAKDYARILTGKRGRPAYDDKTWDEIMSILTGPKVRFINEDAQLTKQATKEANWAATQASHQKYIDKKAMNKITAERKRGLYNTSFRQGSRKNPSFNMNMLEFPEFIYKPLKSPETNLKRFTEHVLEQYPDMNTRDIEKYFTNTFSLYFKLGGTLNYLNFFK